MTERENTGAGEVPAARLKRLLCKRTGERVEPREHAECPYCFGRLADVEKGQHETFCDYREDRDPVSFGFPPGDSRFDRG